MGIANERNESGRDEARVIVATRRGVEFNSVFDERATAANTKRQREEKQEEDAGAKNKTHRRSCRYEVHCFTVGASTRDARRPCTWRPDLLGKRDDVRHRVPLRHAIAPTDSSTFLRVSLSPFRSPDNGGRALRSVSYVPTRAERLRAGYGRNRARFSETYVRLNRFAGVKPAGRRRLLPVERDGKGGKKEKRKRRRTVGTCGEASVAPAWRGTGGNEEVEGGSGTARRRERKMERGRGRDRGGERARDEDRDSISLTASGWRRGARTTLPFPPTKDRSPSSVPAWRGFPTGAFTTYNLPHAFLVRLPDSARAEATNALTSVSRYLRKRNRLLDLRRSITEMITVVQ
ncbi:Uncharacterized protein DBV15_04558 [Temnothorax longispinosus]|uniref:Uncharacterized protein n=1 Tax=Temnothorax longispinosus TaxID=300112 RepID=A0A4S2KJV8_9HYME|nr:Uncharacterized protein DBV15_04558 [Temnothorax longispinosus]